MDSFIKSHEDKGHVELCHGEIEINFDQINEVKLNHGIFHGTGEISVEVQCKKFKFVLYTFKEDEAEMVKFPFIKLPLPFTIRLVGDGTGPVTIYWEKIRHEVFRISSMEQIDNSAKPPSLEASVEEEEEVVEEPVIIPNQLQIGDTVVDDKIDVTFSTDEEKKPSLIETPACSESSETNENGENKKNETKEESQLSPVISTTQTENRKRNLSINVEDIMSSPLAKRHKGAGRPVQYPQLEKIMHLWLGQYSDRHEGNTPELPLIVRQARSFAKELKIEKFVSSVAYSKSCLKRYKNRDEPSNEIVIPPPPEVLDSINDVITKQFVLPKEDQGHIIAKEKSENERLRDVISSILHEMKPTSWQSLDKSINIKSLSVSQIASEVKSWKNDYGRDQKNAHSKRLEKRELHAKLDLIKLIEDELTKSTAVKDVKKWVTQTKNQTRSKLKELKKAK